MWAVDHAIGVRIDQHEAAVIIDGVGTPARFAGVRYSALPSGATLLSVGHGLSSVVIVQTWVWLWQ